MTVPLLLLLVAVFLVLGFVLWQNYQGKQQFRTLLANLDPSKIGQADDPSSILTSRHPLSPFLAKLQRTHRQNQADLNGLTSELHQAQARLSGLELILTFVPELALPHPPEQLIPLILNLVQNLLPQATPLLWLADTHTRIIPSSPGGPPPRPEIARVAQTSVPVGLRDATGQPEGLATPILYHLKLQAVLEVKTTTPLSPDQEELLALVCHLVASALTSSRQRRDSDLAGDTDDLTQLYSRRRLSSDLRRELSHTTRHGTTLALILLDIDHFKNLNQSFGHPAGDQTLRHLAGQIKSVVRDSDMIYRYAGESFLLLLRETPQAGAMELAERIRVALARPDWDSPLTAVTGSFGVAELQVGETPGQFLHRLESALTLAKQSGRNTVVAAV